MKCDDCLSRLEEYIDGEASAHDAEQISAHLIKCAGCANAFEAFTAEQEIFARYDRELNVSPSTWNAIAARTAAETPTDSWSRTGLRDWFGGLFAAPRFGYAFSGALAVSVLAVVFGLVYLRIHQQPSPSSEFVAKKDGVTPVKKGDGAGLPNPPTAPENDGGKEKPKDRKNPVNVAVLSKNKLGPIPPLPPGQSDVLFPDIAYSDIEEKDTAEHVRQAENLLRSIRNLQTSDNDNEIDVSYERAMSRRLLSENEVLRRDAEMAGKFPTKELLKDLEPFLIDIANLPDKTTSGQIRAIKDRVQNTEIVAALVSY